MCANAQTLSSGLEDYIEAIYIAHINNIPLKGADLARKLNISRASVSEALSKLVAKELIKYNSYETISLTKTGIEEAKKVYAKHHILKDFFETVLDINSDEAGENACKIEHIISQNILDKMSNFTEFYKKHKKRIETFKKEI
ncbi:metal-dependent transcriptional regulator [bacterium]|nr:metal-dependent transcriptional regulator [bacterium]